MLEELLKADAVRVVSSVDWSALDGAHILVSGASGLIGSHLVATICEFHRGGLDVALSAVVHRPPAAHLTQLLAQCDASVITHELRGHGAVDCRRPVDLAIFAAGSAQPSVFTSDPIGTIAINTSGLLAVAACVRPGGTLLYLSSSEIYSGLPAMAAKESDIGRTTPTHPRAAYIEGKRCGEALCSALARQELSTRIARVSSAYGPGVALGDTRVMSQFIDSALSTGSIRLRDSGQASRKYCYVTDVEELLWDVALRGEQPLYNVGGQSSTTIRELAELVGRLTNASVEVPATDDPLAGAPSAVGMDLSRVTTEFGKSQYISLEEGLRRTIAWHGALHDAAD
jgi:nucleoside-diphosphate-sugar epimerase